MISGIDSVEQGARALAADNRQSDPALQGILWFPADDQIRLVLLTAEVPAAGDDPDVHPFYFRPSPEHGLTFNSAIAMIRPDERGKLRLPPSWGAWQDAVEL